MDIYRTSDFTRALKRLPSDANILYAVQERRFLENWRDARLHTKRLRGLDDVLSFRVTRRYRVLFFFRNRSTAVFFDIGHRKDVYE